MAIAMKLFESLFGFPFIVKDTDQEQELLIDFFVAWSNFQRKVIELDVNMMTYNHITEEEDYLPTFEEAYQNRIERDIEDITPAENYEIQNIMEIMKKIVNGKKLYDSGLTINHLTRLNELTDKLELRKVY